MKQRRFALPKFAHWAAPPALILALALIGCAGLRQGPPETSTQPANATAINHIIIMVQENRSFDSYFAKLRDFRAANGASSDVDVEPAGASNPADDGTAIHAFHLQTGCIDNLSPDWLESHGDVNRFDPATTTDILMDGFVHTAAGLAQFNHDFDTRGVRAMGFYDSNDLPFYYFLATQFAISDRWFAPAPSNSEVNRIFLHEATSEGHAHKPSDSFPCCSGKTIFHELQDSNHSWKIYYTNTNPNNGNKPLTDLNDFWPSFADQHAGNIVQASQFFNDAKNGQLPQVALIQTGYLSGQDEHPGGNTPGDPNPNAGTHVQVGAQYVASFVNALMASPSWQDSVFILFFDEGGGMYDHVPPLMNVPSPDGIPPRDLLPNDPPGDFTRTGMRVPMMVISPFAKKGFVSHTPADYTAVLRFIEARFQLAPLSKRDAAMMDMTEFFDFGNPPWKTPPATPAQPMTLVCDRTLLPANP
jgi:phospholipase C